MRRIRSRDGLIFIPRQDFHTVSAVDRVVLPGGDVTDARQQTIAAWQRLRPDRPVEYIHRNVGRGESAYDATLQDLAQSRNALDAVGVAHLLFYPVEQLQLNNARLPIEPIATPLMLGLLGVGLVVWVYQKAHPVPGEENLRLVPGNGQIPVVATPYGRLASVVCYDTDFLDIISRTGQANADLLLSPAGDWREIDPYHTQMSAFTAIETGSSMVKQTDGGLSMAATDFYSTDPQMMVAYVPMQGVHTIYATIGDLFAWLSMAGLVVLIGFAIARRRKAGEAEAAAPSAAGN